MRIGNRGLGTGAIIGIVVVVVVVVGVVAAIVLMGGGGNGGAPGGLPVYAGATKIAEGDYMGVTAFVYSFTDSAETVYNWYESNIPAGWTLVDNSGYVVGAGSSIVYEKGNDQGVVAIFVGDLAQQYGIDKVLVLALVPKSPT